MNNKEVLDIIKQMVADGVINQETAKKYFPELKENEDEKIRKSLIHYFEDFHLDTFACLDPKKILAWLEKQGEQEPVDINISEFDTRLNKLLIQFESLSKEELTNSLSFYLNVIQNDGTYKEQKSVEWSEEDEEMLKCERSLCGIPPVLTDW